MMTESLFHLVWHCFRVNCFFWKDLTRFIIDNIDPTFSLCLEHVLFGFINIPSNKRKE